MAYPTIAAGMLGSASFKLYISDYVLYFPGKLLLKIRIMAEYFTHCRYSLCSEESSSMQPVKEKPLCLPY
jgi:predicted solute-binding protein